MLMRSALSTCALVALMVAAAVTQDRPDFSGTWTLVSPSPAPPNAPQTLVVSATFRRQSARGVPLNPSLVTLGVDARSGTLVRSAIYNVGMIGGVVGGLPATRPQTSSRFSTRWDGDRLVVDLAYYADGKLTSEHGEVWSLDGGMLSIAVTDHVVGEAQIAATRVYKRQQ